MTSEYNPRAYQVPPEGDWREWGIWGGRGCGKTSAIVRFIAGEIMAGQVKRVLVVSPREAVLLDAIGAIDAHADKAGRVLGMRVRGVPCSLEWRSEASSPRPCDGAWVRGISCPLGRSDIRGDNYDLVWCTELRATGTSVLDDCRLAARIGKARVVWDCTPDPMAVLLGESAPTIRSVVRRRDGSVSVTQFPKPTPVDVASDVTVVPTRPTAKQIEDIVAAIRSL